MKVAIVQMSMSPNKEKNIAKADSFLRKAKSEGAELVLLPELFALPYFCKIENYDYFDLAEEFGGPLTSHYQELAKELGLILPISFFEKKHNSYFNSLVVFDREYGPKRLYRKTHIPTGAGYEEKFYFTPGTEVPHPISTSVANVGIGICWDQWFPEVARILSINGAEILMYPTAIGSEPVTHKDSSIHWRNAMVGHAAANIIPVMASNRIGTETDGGTSITFYGSSFILDQHGEVLASMDKEEEGIRVVDLDLKSINRERREWGVFRDRRPNLYKDLIGVGPIDKFDPEK